MVQGDGRAAEVVATNGGHDGSASSNQQFPSVETAAVLATFPKASRRRNAGEKKPKLPAEEQDVAASYRYRNGKKEKPVLKNYAQLLVHVCVAILLSVSLVIGAHNRSSTSPPPTAAGDAFLAQETGNAAATHTARVYTAPPPPFPSRKLFCADNRPPVVKGFLDRGFEQLGTHKNAVFIYYMYRRATQIINSGNNLKPWQRPNWIPGMQWIDDKDLFIQGMEMYEESPTGRKFPFFPESYRLCNPVDRQNFLHALQDGEMDVPWVLKDATIGSVRSSGVIFLEARSTGLKLLEARLKELEMVKLKPNIHPVRSRKRQTPVDMQLDRALKELCSPKNYVVQKYLGNLLTYEGRKFNIRAFFLVASVDPLMVYYHDGYLHVSPVAYNATNFAGDPRLAHFSSINWMKKKHSQEEFERADVSFGDFDRYLRKYTTEESPRLRHISDPLLHVRSQMKAIMSEVIFAFRKMSFAVEEFPPENAYLLIGVDFFVDRDLRVWMIESNNFPGVRGESQVKKDELHQLIPEMVDMVSEVYEKQLKGEKVAPLKSANTFELIFTDEYRYTYKF